MSAKIAAKPRAPRTSESQCLLARTLPTLTRTMKVSIKKSRSVTATLDLMYLGKIMAIRRRTVATTMTWVEGKDASPEPSGRVFQMRNLSKTTYVIAISVRGRGNQRSSLSTFIRDLRLIHWISPRTINTRSMAKDATSMILVILSHCIALL